MPSRRMDRAWYRTGLQRKTADHLDTEVRAEKPPENRLSRIPSQHEPQMELAPARSAQLFFNRINWHISGPDQRVFWRYSRHVLVLL
jgi:hypothetical protein